MPDLPERLRRGDPAAFDDFHRRFSGRIHRFVQRLVGRTDAEDLTQEVLLRVLASIRSYRGSDRFEAWLYTIAHNVCVDRLRRRPVAPLHGAEPEEETPDMTAVREERLQALLEEVRALPFEQRRVFLLRLEAGLTFREIAVLLEEPLGTVLARMKYATDRLRARLRARGVSHVV